MKNISEIFTDWAARNKKVTIPDNSSFSNIEFVGTVRRKIKFNTN